MKIAVLALQGAFIEHEKMLDSLGVSSFEIRQASDLERSFDGLILPGGESTVMGKLLKELKIFDELKDRIAHGLPVLATCAGLILLASKIENDEKSYFKTLDVTVKRNAFGRQLGSFHTTDTMLGIGIVPMTFIRAPIITEVGCNVEILATVQEKIVAVREENQLALAFHPELDDSLMIHDSFIKSIGH